MRIGGLATGMDIDELVEKLMSAERIPLDKMEQDKTKLTWKRDAFRDVNKSLLELDNMMLQMKKGSTYNSKSVFSSNEAAVTGTASSSTSNGTYTFDVDVLAKPEVIMGGELDIEDANEAMGKTESFHFYTYDEDGKALPYKIDIEENDSLNDVLKRITDDDNGVRAFYDKNQKKVIMETTRDGVYNESESGREINFNFDVEGIKFNDDYSDFEAEGISSFTGFLKLETEDAQVSHAKDAEFKYNGIDMTSKSNTYEINGMQVNFQAEGNATLQVQNDTQSTVDSIMAFVDKYNEVVETFNDTQWEERNRDFPPLTDEQKKEMSEDEIEKWEEKAKSGILRGESTISSGLFDMRRSWYSNVETDGPFSSLTQLGITTSKKYLDGGKLEVDIGKLTKAVQENPDGVQKLFANSTKDEKQRGIINRLDDAVESTMKKIRSRAGGQFDTTLESYTIGKEMKSLNTRISDFERRLEKVETRYWNQFTQMEKAIQRMNMQSEQLMSQFGGGM